MDEPRDDRFRFGMRSMLVLTVLCGVILAFSRWIGSPVLAQVLISGYFIILTTYLVLRAPTLWKRRTRLAQRSAENRRALEQELASRETAAETMDSLTPREDLPTDADSA
ncbi:MAG: hypothetical protein N2C14_21790 [Planctomycetales bacterium]